MNFSNLNELLTMDGHGLYVWSAYAIALLVVLFNLVRPIQLKQRFIKEQQRYLRREEVDAPGS